MKMRRVSRRKLYFVARKYFVTKHYTGALARGERKRERARVKTRPFMAKCNFMGIREKLPRDAL